MRQLGLLRPYLFGRPVGLVWGENPLECGHPGHHLEHTKSRPRGKPFHPTDRPLAAAVHAHDCHLNWLAAKAPNPANERHETDPCRFKGGEAMSKTSPQARLCAFDDAQPAFDLIPLLVVPGSTRVQPRPDIQRSLKEGGKHEAQDDHGQAGLRFRAEQHKAHDCCQRACRDRQDSKGQGASLG